MELLGELELIKKAQSGSLSAFSELIHLYKPTVEKFAYQLGNPYHDIEDITQEVFIRVYRFIHQFSHSKFSTWLYKITLNVTRDFARKRQMHFQRIEKVKKEKIVSVDYVEEHLIFSEEERALNYCIQKLDQKYRVPIVLYYLHHKKYSEIAEILNIPLATVKIRLLRGKELLRKLYIELEGMEGETYG